MKRICLILLGLAAGASAQVDRPRDMARVEPAWIETLWKDHLMWRIQQPHSPDNDLERVCRDLLRLEPTHSRAVERLGIHYAAQKEYALMAMASLYGHFLIPGHPEMLQRWEQAIAAITDFPLHPPLNTENIPDSTFYLQRLSEARRFLKDGDYIGCENALRALLIRYPANQEILADLGSLYVIKSEWAMCALLYRYAFQLYPGDANFLNNHALAMEQTGYPELAYALVGQHIRQHPGKGFLHRTMGRLALQLHQPAEAVKIFAAWTGQEPLNAEAWESYGIALIAADQWVFAKVAFNKALAYAPRRPYPWYYLAKISVLEKNIQQARKDLEKLSARVDPETFKAWIRHAPFRDLPELQAMTTPEPGMQEEAP